VLEAVEREEKMRKILIVAIVVLCLFGLVYFGQAQKATKVNEVRLRARYEKGEISKEQYEVLIQKNSLLNNLLNPKAVGSVD